jgi:Ca2+-binding RTX toxin-like protein
MLKGGGGADTIDGGSGNDTLTGGYGADLFVGGSGEDTADYSQAAAYVTRGVFVNLETNVGYFGEAQGDTFDSIENVTGSAYSDDIYGNDVANLLRGGFDNDHLYGNGGDDRLDGGDGSDYLDGGTGVDTMIGGAGDDTYWVDNAADVVNEVAGQGNDVIKASADYTLSATAEIEFMLMPAPDFRAVSFSLAGNNFNQFISGNNGTNTLDGGGGADRLYGDGGSDRLFGGEGDDSLSGDSGPDDLIGGAGADQFVYHETLETGITAGSFDVIHDFSRAEGDLINVSQWDSNDLVAGNQDWTFVGATTSFKAPGQIGVSSDGIDTFILFNTDNDAIHEATIRIVGLHTVDASWFVL